MTRSREWREEAVAAALAAAPQQRRLRGGGCGGGGAEDGGWRHWRYVDGDGRDKPITTSTRTTCDIRR